MLRYSQQQQRRIMKLRDLKGKFGTRFSFMADVINHCNEEGVFNIAFFIAEDPHNSEKITMIQDNMKGGFISFNEGSIWDYEVIVFNS